MNILEDLWFGNISPWERPFKKDSAYAELLALVIRHQDDLLGRLILVGNLGAEVDMYKGGQWFVALWNNR